MKFIIVVNRGAVRSGGGGGILIGPAIGGGDEGEM